MVKNIEAELFIQNSPQGVIIDVRTPAEYAAGHIVGAVNMPLFTNEERAVVGTIYKQQSKDKAIEKGLEFVGPRMAEMVKMCRKLLRKADKTTLYIYCWRGGMRSNSVAWLMQTAGMEVRVLHGGYKAYRHSFTETLLRGRWRLMVVGGPTGCGKTYLLEELQKQGEQIIDLEEIAKHKGSAFGRHGFEEAQPSSEHFANILYDELLKLDENRIIWCEGESMSIGHVFMPQEMYNLIQKSPFVYYEIPLEDRIDHIMEDYGTCPKEGLIACFEKIKKRLGYDRAQMAIEAVENGDIRSATEIAITYYDKGYANSIGGRQGAIIDKVKLTSYNLSEAAQRLIKIREKYANNN